MGFDERFELGELLRDDGVQSFSARERANARDLQAHFLTSPEQAAALLASMDRLPEWEQQRIVDRGEYRAPAATAEKAAGTG
jgi:hypothetical protein